MRNAIIALALLGTAGYFVFKNDDNANNPGLPGTGNTPVDSNSEQSPPAGAQTPKFAVGQKLRVLDSAIIADLYRKEANGEYVLIQTQGVSPFTRMGAIVDIQFADNGQPLYMLRAKNPANAFLAVSDQGVQPYVGF